MQMTLDSEAIMAVGLISQQACQVDPVPIVVVTPTTYCQWHSQQSQAEQRMLAAQSADPSVGSLLWVFAFDGALRCVVAVVDPQEAVWCLAHLPSALPEAVFVIDDPDSLLTQQAYLGWGLAHYHFAKYQADKSPKAQLVVSADILAYVEPLLLATCLVRDLVNTPANDMGPEGLEKVMATLVKTHRAKMQCIKGEQLLKQNYPGIYHVGKAGSQAPRFLTMQWGKQTDPVLVLVGKGVCFDTGGLDIKPSSGMLLMKKDMGGAAHVLGLAQLIMQAALPVRLHVMIPAVENNVDAIAYRPGDVLTMRDGTTVEITNTDAEGRLVLADALTDAVALKPDLLLDFATLTGAARVALGPNVPAMFTQDKQLAASLMQVAESESDPVWHMPLVAKYRSYLESNIADMSNAAKTGYGGAITAALFLQHFVQAAPWVHFDLMAWNTSSEPGRPEGGEAMALRAVFAFLQQRYR